MSRNTAESLVRSWGFAHVFTWTDPPRAYYAPHSHAVLTTHLLKKGKMTMAYPHDESSKKKEYSAGDRVDVEANKVHEVWIGDTGCEYVIGEA